MRRPRRAVAAGDGVVLAAPMRDSAELFRHGDVGGLRARLAEDGYLLVRGLVPARDVRAARRAVLSKLQEECPGVFRRPGSCAPRPGAARVGLIAKQHVAALPVVRAALEHPRIFSLIAALLGGAAPPVTATFKWLRAVCPSEFTGVHMDSVYVRGAEDCLTAWMPVGDVPVSQGALLVARGSNRLPSFSALRDGYGRTTPGADGTSSGWLTADGSELAAALPAGSAPPEWVTADFRAGDVAVLPLRTTHMTARNASGALRLSADTRWQRATDARDPRLKDWRSAAADDTL